MLFLAYWKDADLISTLNRDYMGVLQGIANTFALKSVTHEYPDFIVHIRCNRSGESEFHRRYYAGHDYIVVPAILKSAKFLSRYNGFAEKMSQKSTDPIECFLAFAEAEIPRLKGDDECI